MSLKDVKVYDTAIIEAHFVGLINHVLAINTLSQIQELNVMLSVKTSSI